MHKYDYEYSVFTECDCIELISMFVLLFEDFGLEAL